MLMMRRVILIFGAVASCPRSWFLRKMPLHKLGAEADALPPVPLPPHLCRPRRDCRPRRSDGDCLIGLSAGNRLLALPTPQTQRRRLIPPT
uniref:Secreted protein n=1 Tax=Arundo donax TaxID=35708 RepID=A0A0A9C1K0_ARUDO